MSGEKKSPLIFHAWSEMDLTNKKEKKMEESSINEKKNKFLLFNKIFLSLKRM